MKTRHFIAKRILPLAASTTALLSIAAPLAVKAATYTWDTVSGDGTTITAGDGTWNTTAGNLVWNNAGANPNLVWAQTNATTALHQAVFGGSDGTYVITVGSGIAAQKIRFANSGYTLSAASSQIVTLTATAGTGTQPQIAIDSVVS